MSVGFAGSRTLDDRRRRRLAQNAETGKRRAPARPAVTPAESEFAASPIESLVRPQLWVNVLLATFGFSLGGAAIYLGEWIPANYPAATNSFGPRGLLIRALGVVQFVLAAQLAAAIHWYRARSRKDFNGRYRIWHFVVPSLLAFGFCAATDGHLVFAEWAQNRWQLSGPHAQTLLWMVPAGTVLLAMVRLLHTEMRGTVSSALSLWMAVLAAIANAVVVLHAPLPIAPHVMELVGRSAALLWPLGLLLSLLFYARCVIYISNEPSALPAQNPTSQDSQQNWSNWWRPRKSNGRHKPVETDEPVSGKKQPAAAPASEVEQPKPAPSATEAAQSRQPRVDAKQDVDLEPEIPGETQRNAGKRSAETENTVRRSDHSHGEDDFDDADDLHDQRLSKKERKKQRRLRQRERRGELA